MKSKSLITKLVAFMLSVMMVIGCLPVGVFAAENDWEAPDIDLAPGFNPDEPLEVVFTWNETETVATATVSVPDGFTMYFFSWQVVEELDFTANDVAVENVTYGEPRMSPTTWSLTGGEYNLVLSTPVGHRMNPKALELGYNDVSLAEGNAEGYYYTWTAAATGDLSFNIETITEGVEADILINNNTSYANKTLAEDGVENDFGTMVVTMPVTAGDEVSIQVVVMPDDSYSYPAADITHYSTFTYPLGSENNPIILQEPENTVTNEGTVYYQGYFSGMNMTVAGEGDFSVIYNGQNIAAVDGQVSTPVASANPRMPVIFAIVGDGEYTVNFTYPLGNMSNPATAVLGDNVAEIEAGNSQGYFWTYTAEKAGDLVFNFSSNDGNWAYTINNMTTYVYGEQQWSDSDPVVNPATVTVAEGDVLQIVVNTYNPADMWGNPAGTVSFNMEYKPEIVKFKLVGAVVNLGDSLGIKYIVAKSNVPNPGEGYTAVITRHYADGRPDDVLTIEGKDWATYSSKYFAVEYLGVAAKEMCDQMEVVIYNADGDAVSETWVDSIRDYAMRQLKTSSDANLKVCLVDLLNYGAAAQVDLGYGESNLANNQLTTEQAALATKDAKGTDVKSASPEAAFVGSTPSLKSAIVFKLIMKSSYMNNDIANCTAEISFNTHKGTPISYVISGKDFEPYGTGRVSINITGLSVASYDSAVTCVLKDANGNVIATVVDSIGGYLQRQVNNNTAGDVFLALLKFGSSAYNYFKNK